MHLKNHLMDGQLHVVFNLQRSQKKVISVIREIIGSSSQFLIHIHNSVCHIADVHDVIRVRLKVKAIKVHDFSFIRKDDIHNKIAQLATVLIRHIFFKMLYIDRVDVCADVIHGTVFFFQRLLHNVQHDCENHIQLFVNFQKTILPPDCLLTAVLYQDCIQSHVFHSFWKVFQKIVLHLSTSKNL